MITAADIPFASDIEAPTVGVLERLSGGGYAYVLTADNIRIEVRYIRREHAHMHAEVDVQC